MLQPEIRSVCHEARIYQPIQLFPNILCNFLSIKRHISIDWKFSKFRLTYMNLGGFRKRSYQ